MTNCLIVILAERKFLQLLIESGVLLQTQIPSLVKVDLVTLFIPGTGKSPAVSAMDFKEVIWIIERFSTFQVGWSEHCFGSQTACVGYLGEFEF